MLTAAQLKVAEELSQLRYEHLFVTKVAHFHYCTAASLLVDEADWDEFMKLCGIDVVGNFSFTVKNRKFRSQ